MVPAALAEAFARRQVKETLSGVAYGTFLRQAVQQVVCHGSVPNVVAQVCFGREVEKQRTIPGLIQNQHDSTEIARGHDKAVCVQPWKPTFIFSRRGRRFELYGSCCCAAVGVDYR